MTTENFESEKHGGRLRKGEAEQFWSKTLDEWHRSGLTQTAFCEKRGVSMWALSFWKRKLGWKANGVQKKQKQNARKRFVPIEIVSQGNDYDVVEIRLRNGFVVRVSEDIDGDALDKIISILEDMQ